LKSFPVFRALLLTLATASLAACRHSPPDQTSAAMLPHDPHSYASQGDAIVRHLSLNLDVSFSARVLSGSATWTIETTGAGKKLVLDTRGLTILNVTADGKKTSFTLGGEQPHLGRPLTIAIEPSTTSVRIDYQTSPDAGALQWLDPEQTAGKKTPFLFTQSQAILARTWVPCQDSPGIRFTYDATVHVPAGMLALMSAENPQEKNSESTYRFRMPQPIPSYLMAMAAGDIAFRAFDGRTGVYAEPATLDAAAYEFADLPKMVDAAEHLYGPYEWGRYDVLILPPSFPFGGMENPRLTFATPTILAGDRSLTSLVAHELAHSWSGNLVTNATWNDFWLNEGFTVYFENRIMEALYGKDVADMHRILGQESLKETIEEFGADSADTHLRLHLEGRDPDDGVSDIAYEKGNNLLLVIEQAVGRERFDAFLKGYFKKHAFQTMDTEKFLAEYREDLLGGDSALAAQIHIEEWIDSGGLPSNMLHIRSRLFDAVDSAVSAWKKGMPAKDLATGSYSTDEWLRFLNTLPDTLTEQQMEELENTFHFSQSGNAEILFAWFQQCLRHAFRPAVPAISDFLVRVGRRKFVKPLFAELIKTPDGRKMAETIYARARSNYHSVTRNTIDEMMAKKP
jgi:leukotriene-A4 hydrolase